MKTKLFQPLAALRSADKTTPQFRSGRPLMVTYSMLVFLSGIAIGQAAIVEFDLSPTGTSPGVGLSPANETPPVVGSTGSGNEVSGGIFFDTTTSTLSFAMGYGSSAGFTNLTGAATALHIHGPAAVGASAVPLFDLAAGHFPSPVPANGGIIFGSVVYSAADATNLLAGLNYVNIHTATNPNGEIRGQLIRQNAAPDVIPPVDATVECGVPVTFSATVSDFDGDAVQAVWSLNGVAVETDSIPAAGPPSTAVITYTATLHEEGANTLSVIATDSAGNITTASATITVEDTTPPVIELVSADPKVLWPPNHKMIPITVKAKVTDACGPATWEILSVSSNQAVDEKGSGNTSPDWKITGDHTVSLRAERSGKIKSDRVYTIKIQATDEAGNKSEISTVKVSVPHDQGKK